MSKIAQDPLTAALAPLVAMIADAVAERLGRSRFLTAAQIADEFGLAPRAIRTARQRNELQGVRHGHAIVFERGTVELWLAGTAPAGRAANDPLDVAAEVQRSLASVGLRASR